MNSPLRVFVQCYGRLANQLITWANAMHWTRNISNCVLLLGYPPLYRKCQIPRTEFMLEKPKWPEITVANLASLSEDSILTNGWDCPAPGPAHINYLKSIRFDPNLLRQAGSLAGQKRAIGVHIRYGDYVTEDEASKSDTRPPFVRQPNDYYHDAVKQCVDALPGYGLVLCSDGAPEELEWFTSRWNPMRQPQNDGVLDFLTLSQCKLIVSSASTFAPTASALHDVPLIHPETCPANRIAAIEAAKRLP